MKKPVKKSRPLPTRGGLNDLGKTGRTIGDYAKAVPTLPGEIEPAAIVNLANPRKAK
jgi:hypothetical protein